jgi:uncharacterized protein (DUF58 family)
LAAALSYIALCGGDRVQVFTQSDGDGEASRQFRGRGAAPELFGWLALRRPGGGTDLPTAVRYLQRAAPAPGLTFLLSDLLTPDWESFTSCPARSSPPPRAAICA